VTRPYDIGDRVSLATPGQASALYSMVVKDIFLMRTHFLTANGESMMVNNSTVKNMALTNYARSGARPPLECIFWIPRLYSTCIPPVSHRILGIPLYPCIYLHPAVLQQIHCILLYPAVSSCICTNLAVSSCIQLYLTVSHRLENGIRPKIHSRGGLVRALFPRSELTKMGLRVQG